METDAFNCQLDETLDDANFMIEGKGEFKLMYLDDIDVDDNPGVRHPDKQTTPSFDDYGDMAIDDRPEDEDEEAVDNYINVELIMDVGSSGEQCGHVIKRSRGPEGEPIR